MFAWIVAAAAAALVVAVIRDWMKSSRLKKQLNGGHVVDSSEVLTVEAADLARSARAHAEQESSQYRPVTGVPVVIGGGR